MIYVIGGPTGSGKSDLALAFAKRIGGAIINADAFQVYQGMDIGTNKPSPADLSSVPHYLVNIVTPREGYDIARYQADARRTIIELKSKGIPIIMCGGSGLYLRAALYDYVFPAQTDEIPDFHSLSSEELFARLQTIDPEAATSTHPHNRRRVIRALEIHARTGITKSALIAAHEPNLLYDACFVGLRYDRKGLYEKVERRVIEMIEAGLVEEVRRLVSLYGSDAQALQAIGYRQMLPFLDGSITLEQTITDIKTATRRYVKRQDTFFNRQLPMEWFPSKEEAIQYLNRKHELHE